MVLTGPNGAGKTNVLEAVSFLVPGRGLRRARLAEPARRIPGDDPDAPPRAWAVAATLEDPAGPFDAGTGLVPAATGDGRRTVRIDGEEMRSQAALAERIAVLWLTPDMQRLFTDGASGRRRFLDRMVFADDPAHAGRLQAYEKALRDRARVLSDARRDGRAPDGGWLGALEAAMVERGMAVAAARAALVRRLNPACAMGVGPFPAARLSLSGPVDCWLAEMPAVDAEEKFLAALRDGREEDAILRGATTGPHKSDLEVDHVARNAPARQCSTGEQKALLISIILANARLRALDAGTAPILLLDEVAAHLDEVRREALFEEILALGAQAWMTGTDSTLFSSLGASARHFTVADAAIAPAR